MLYPIIGPLEHLGKAGGSLASSDDVTIPQDTTTWEYYDRTMELWKSTNPGDVIVANIPNSKNLRLIKMKSTLDSVINVPP